MEKGGGVEREAKGTERERERNVQLVLVATVSTQRPRRSVAVNSFSERSRGLGL